MADQSQILEFIPQGKLRCIVTGKLRRDTSEENVRQRVARSLMDDYGYGPEDIAIEFRIKLGSSRKSVDIAIFEHGGDHTQEKIRTIIECKDEKVGASDSDNGVDQLKSYMAGCLNCNFGMWVGSELQVFEKHAGSDGIPEFLLATDIPRAGAEAPTPIRFSDLVPAEDELVSVFRRCHNYIHGNQGFPKDRAFNELQKIIFCKVQDEYTLSDELQFFISNDERRSDIGQRRLNGAMARLFEAVKQRYPYIFDDKAKIELHNPVLAYVVSELQRYSIMQTRADVKGTAYEQLVGSNLRGDRGEFFTPRRVCEMAAEMILATFPKNEWLNINVLDPAAGTGGFLVAFMNVLKEHIRQMEAARWVGDLGKIDWNTDERLKEVASSNLYGIDFNPELVQAAQMNLVMHGDGSTNVHHANSLAPPGEWSDEPPNDVRRNIPMGYFDAIITNPPFGSDLKIDDPHILRQFQLCGYELEGSNARGSMTPDQLFIERCIQLLRPGGRLAIVLPDSILSNPGLLYIRKWVLSTTRVIASVDLPKETFQPHTGTQTSVLLLQKKTDAEIATEEELGRLREYEIFMAIPEAVGHDRRGNVNHLRTAEGNLIEYEDVETVYRRSVDGSTTAELRKHRRLAVHNELPAVVRRFRSWVNESGRSSWIND